MNRRKFMTLGAATIALASSGSASAIPREADGGTPPDSQPDKSLGLKLESYEPKSMLHLPETHIPRSRFPLIDFHTHITEEAHIGPPQFNMEPQDCLAVMDRKNIRVMVNLTGGYGEGLQKIIEKLQHPHPERFVVFTE